MINREQKSNFLILSGLLFTFFYTWSSAFSLISIWLTQHIGLNSEQAGMTFSAIAVTALCAQPLYGYIQDKLGLKKNLLWFIGFLLLLSGPFFIFVYAPLLAYSIFLGAVVGGIYVGVTFFAGIGVLESYTERVSRINQFEFGRARMCGSLGWAIATFFAGRLFNYDPNINFWIASISALCFLFLLWRLNEVKVDAMTELEYGKSENISLKHIAGIIKNTRFWALVLFVIGVSVYNVYDQQFPVYFASLFSNVKEGNEMYSTLNALQVFLEAGGMFLAPWLVNRIGAKKGLLLSGLLMSLRIIGSGLVDTPLLISFMKLLHAVELPILLISMFKYITSRFDPRLSATLYLVGFQFITQVCASLLSSLAGRAYDHIGFAQTYLYLGSIVLILTLLSTLFLTADHKVKKQ